MNERSVEAQVHTRMDDLRGRCAVISGGTSGIGRATALLLASYGARVLVFGRHPEAVDDTVQAIERNGGDSIGLVADQSRADDLRRVFAEADRVFPALDILINNAAISAGSILDKSEEQWRYAVECNLIGYLACTQHAIQRMRPRRHGHIINIGSMSAQVREKGSSVYVATKAAIQGFSEALRKEVNELGIKVTLIEPGRVDTDIFTMPEVERLQRLEEGKLLKPQDVAVSVHYCLTQPDRCDVVSLQLRPHAQEI